MRAVPEARGPSRSVRRAGTPLRRSARPGWYGSGCCQAARSCGVYSRPTFGAALTKCARMWSVASARPNRWHVYLRDAPVWPGSIC